MTVLGIDEVGRGCWAGPLVAGAVLLDATFVVPSDVAWRLNDSKQLSKRQRDLADVGIRESALAYGLGWVSNHEVDQLGLTAAVTLAMQRAADAALAMYDSKRYVVQGTTKSASDGGVKDAKKVVDEVIIDGSINYLPHLSGSRAVIKADGSVAAVSAASIIAKVARDNWMASEAERLFPGYGFAKHVGYGTKVHQEALLALGVSELHRRSFRPVASLC